jgi:hypothetical protein
VNACFGQQPNILGLPTLAGYSSFLYNTVGIPVTALPTTSFNIQLSFALALDIVSTWLQCMQSDIYTIAVYNLATDRLINFCPDQGTPPLPGELDTRYFASTRRDFTINQFVAGVVQTSNDQGTGDGLLVPDFMKGLTLMDLANLNTPYGRQYLALAQQLGPGVWGLS